MSDTDAPAALTYVAAGPLKRYAFGTDLILFNPLSWETHVLNEAASAVLELIEEAPRSIEEIAEFFFEALTDSEQARALEHAKKVISDLEALELIRKEDRSRRATLRA